MKFSMQSGRSCSNSCKTQSNHTLKVIYVEVGETSTERGYTGAMVLLVCDRMGYMYIQHFSILYISDLKCTCVPHTLTHSCWLTRRRRSRDARRKLTQVTAVRCSPPAWERWMLTLVVLHCLSQEMFLRFHLMT